MPRTAGITLALASALMLSACSPGDVELNGRIFEATGLTTSSTSKKAPKVAERAPLILPPSLERLPPPGSEGSTAVAVADMPVDPEQRRVNSQAGLQAQQAAYCKEHYEKAKALGDETKAAVARGPLGPCQPSALQMLTGTNPLIQR